MTDLPATHEELLARIPIPDGARLEASPITYGHDGTELEGYVAHDAAADEPLPGILIVPDWLGVGPNAELRAQMLARLGYVAFVADVYGAGVRPTSDEAPSVVGAFYRDLGLMRARVQAAYETLAELPQVDDSRIVVIGYCFGGTAALEFARTGADIRGVVSFHGRLLTHDPSDAAAIRGKVLILNGGADPSAPDSDVSAFQDELRSVPSIDWQVNTYSGAPHAFTVPGDRFRPVADARSWRAQLDFFDEVLA
ncbi:dienelactone hydrolase family protein [Planctomonas sp. JC2975]|uniref:dienelactone hydrolase family protein n=1 Tax=Planctomonas sp. JC2975 TaxID=2729626 RepID=UPI0014743963|nr:dienelactone hydrolase family protein [Planctomonas sp. JC2975]NNC13578.1 dienelactone hydrolase family protein [Planctomonas sp. JC2975]